MLPQEYIWQYLSLLFVILLAAAPAWPQVTRQADWDDVFEQQFGANEPLLDINNSNEDGDFAWRGHYWVRAYVSMADTYSDTLYLARAVRLIDRMLAFRDDARFSRGELELQEQPYFSAPLYYLNNRNQAAPGWRRWDAFYKGWRVLMIDDAMITSAMMRFVDLVFADARFVEFRSRAEYYMQKASETADAHSDSFVFSRFENIPGSYYYPAADGSGLHTGAVEFNMSAAMATTLLLLQKWQYVNEENLRKASAILDYFKRHARITASSTYDWDYHPQNTSTGATKSGVEDFNHAHIDVGFFLIAHRSGLALSKTEMQMFANTLSKSIYLGDGELSWSVDGKEMNQQKNYWPVAFDWIELAACDPIILQIAREVYEKHYSQPTWARSYLGWAEILRWTAILASKDSASPQPPDNVQLQRNFD